MTAMHQKRAAIRKLEDASENLWEAGFYLHKAWRCEDCPAEERETLMAYKETLNKAFEETRGAIQRMRDTLGVK